MRARSDASSHAVFSKGASQMDIHDEIEAKCGYGVGIGISYEHLEKHFDEILNSHPKSVTVPMAPYRAAFTMVHNVTRPDIDTSRDVFVFRNVNIEITPFDLEHPANVFPTIHFDCDSFYAKVRVSQEKHYI